MEPPVTSFVPRPILAALRAAAAATLPEECCGLLLGKGGHISALMPSANLHPSPKRHFTLDPQLLVNAERAARGGGDQVLGYYHSHPSGPARPSATDQAMAHGDGRIWAIIGGDIAGGRVEVTLWRDAAQGFTALPYTTGLLTTGLSSTGAFPAGEADGPSSA